MVGVQGSHKDVLRAYPLRVRFTGTTALRRGQGVCYDADRGTAGDAEAERAKYVELPSSTNHRWFAGVTAEGYSAKSSGQWITIFEPGSVCMVAAIEDTTVDSTLLSCIVSTGAKGLFGRGGLYGRGGAIALQTKTTNNYGTGLAVAAAAFDTTALILTHAGQAFDSATVAGGKLHVLAGENDNTDNITAGEYSLTSITSDTVLTTTAVTGTTGGTMTASYYLVEGKPLTLAYLIPGEGHLVSGCTEYLSADVGAVQFMVGGLTRYHGLTTLGSACTATLADGTFPGERKALIQHGTLTTTGILTTVTSGAILETIAADAVALATITTLTDTEFWVMEWGINTWNVMTIHASTLTT